MKRLIWLVTLVFACTMMLAAQGTSGSSSQSGSSDTAGKASKTSKSKGTASSDKMAKSSQLTGCIAAGDKEGTYKLTNGRYKNGVPVTSSDDLKAHVGHTVKLNGTWDKTATPKSFKADKVDMISDSCNAAAGAGKTDKKAKKSAATPPSQ